MVSLKNEDLSHFCLIVSSKKLKKKKVLMRLLGVLKVSFNIIMIIFSSFELDNISYIEGTFLFI
jgi:hypothetical protein